MTSGPAADGAMLTSSQIQLAARPIDPLAPCAPGRYADELVVVTHEDSPDSAGAAPVVRTAHFVLRRRVVVAVPFEHERTAAYGHVQAFSRADLVRLGRSHGRRFRVSEHHGGWLMMYAD